MVTVQLRDANNSDRFLIDHIVLPFEPQLGVPIYVFDRFDRTKNSFFNFGSKAKRRCFVATEVLRYELSMDDPAQSGIVYLAREVNAD
jgi:hypothetical protein